MAVTPLPRNCRTRVADPTKPSVTRVTGGGVFTDSPSLRRVDTGKLPISRLLHLRK